MSRRKARRNLAPVLHPLSRLGRREREWTHGHADCAASDQDVAGMVLARRAEEAMQAFKRSLPARTLKSIGEFRSMRAETRAQMKRTGRPRASAVRLVPITSENEQEALRLLASRSKAHPPDGIQTVAADGGMCTTERDLSTNAVRKQDSVVARTVIPADEKPASRQVGAVIRAADVGAPKQAVTG